MQDRQRHTYGCLPGGGGLFSFCFQFQHHRLLVVDSAPEARSGREARRAGKVGDDVTSTRGVMKIVFRRGLFRPRGKHDDMSFPPLCAASHPPVSRRRISSSPEMFFSGRRLFTGQDSPPACLPFAFTVDKLFHMSLINSGDTEFHYYYFTLFFLLLSV